MEYQIELHPAMAVIKYFPLLTLLLSCSYLISGLPNGAPTSACAGMTPGHHDKDKVPISAQSDSTFPYTFESAFKNGDELYGGDPVTIKLSSNFQGFLIEARQNGDAIGQFDVSGDENIQTIDCGNGQKNAITHTNPMVKESITATWMAPANFDRYQGAVEFHLTVAETHDKFWVDHVVTV